MRTVHTLNTIDTDGEDREIHLSTDPEDSARLLMRVGSRRAVELVLFAEDREALAAVLRGER